MVEPSQKIISVRIEAGDGDIFSASRKAAARSVRGRKY